MSRKFFIAGNWKMNNTVAQGRQLVNDLKAASLAADKVEVGVFPPFTAIATVAEATKGTSLVYGAQDVSASKPGAFTGDIAAEFLVDLACPYCIVGHSERRAIHKESDFLINEKVHRLFSVGIKPIVCIGETLEQRELDLTLKVVHTQLRAALLRLSDAQLRDLTIAYEPVWAIGTGKVATPQQAEEVHAFIRQSLTEMHGAEIAQVIRLQYGGSVNAANAADLLSQPNIDGALVGGASLKPAEFAGIIAAAQKLASTKG